MTRCSDLSFSVITPSFNQFAYLKQTMDSVLSQNIPGMEYVVIDGGSTDGSAELIRSYEDRLSGWVSKKDRGQADAINKGVSLTSVEVIGWLKRYNYGFPYITRAQRATLEANIERIKKAGRDNNL